MSLKTLEFAEAFHVKDITTAEMQKAIKDWYNLYYNKAIESNEDGCQRIPVAVVSKLQKAVFSEYKAESQVDGAADIIKALNRRRKKSVQQALIAGQSWLKPLIFDEELNFAVVTRDNVIVLGRDENNNVTDIGTEEDTEQGGKYYSLLERRSLTGSNGNLVIESRLYVSDKKGELGKRIPLGSLDKYAALEDVIELDIKHIGLIPITCPAENCVDGSDDPVSVYAAATGLIHNINENEMQLKGEFIRGESRIAVSNDLLKTGANGKKTLQDNVFVGLDDDPQSVGFNIFSPTLRDQSFINRKREYLRSIESLIGLKRGILSDVEAVERTAKEITSSEGDYNLTIIDFQEMWENAVRESIKITMELKRIYKQQSSDIKDEDIIVNWGNGVLYDRDKTWAEYVSMVAQGLLKPELAVAYYFDLPHETDEELNTIRTKYMPVLSDLME